MRLTVLERSGFRLTTGHGSNLGGNDRLEIESDHLVGPHGLALKHECLITRCSRRSYDRLPSHFALSVNALG